MFLKRLSTVIPLSIFLIIALSLGAGIMWVGGNTYDAVLYNQNKAMHGLARGTMHALEDYAEQIKSQAKFAASQESVIWGLDGYMEGADKLFRTLLENNPGIWAALVFDAKGQVVLGYTTDGKDLSGEDRSGTEYVSSVLGGKDLVFSPEILSTEEGGGTHIFAVAAAVHDANGKVTGGVVLFPSWDRFTATHLDRLRIGEEGYGFMVDARGRIIAHAVNKDLMLKDLSGQDFVHTLLQQKQGEAEYVWEGRDKRMAFTTLAETGWVVVMSAYEKDLTSTATAQRNVLGVGGIVTLALLTIILTVLLRSMIFNPMNHILDFAGRIADGDLKAELHGRYHFELATLADKIRIMVAELKNKLGFAEGVLDGLTLPCSIVGPDFNVLWVNKLACELMEHGGEPQSYVGVKSGEFFYRDGSRESLADKAIKSGEAGEQEIVYTAPSGRQRNISVSTTPFNDMDGVLLGSLSLWIDLTEIRTQQKQIEMQNERIATAAEKADEVSQYLSTAAEELSAQIEEASRGSETQRNRAAETATAMEEMNTTVLAVAQNAGSASDDADRAKATAEQGASVVGDVIAAIGDVQTKAQDLRASMEELGQQAESIGTVMNVITDIADQTNLLALNAAIEAARAGDAGRGFAVVADEVRKLAEKTMAATKEVGDAINAMQSAAGANVKATESAAESVSRSTELAERSGETLQEIVCLVDNVADQVRSIATAAEQQSATSDEINRSTEEINRVASESAEVMTQSSEAVHDVARMATNLGEIITEMAAK